MNYSVLTIPPFDKQFKKLVKKYPSLKSAIAGLIADLKAEPNKGSSLGNDCCKIRLAIASKVKANQAVPGLSPILLLANILFFCYLFMINHSNRI